MLKIEWRPEVVKEDWDVAKAECRYSVCGGYRVCKIIPLTRDSRPRWGACYLLRSKNKKGKENVPAWWPITTLENGEPKTYRTEDQAFEACDMHADNKHRGNGKEAEPVKPVKAEPKIEKAKAEPKIEKAKEAKPVKAGTKRPRIAVMGYSLTSILHWMGKEGWTMEEVKRALIKLKVEAKPGTIGPEWSGGKNPKYSRPAPLTVDEVRKLESFRK